MAKINTRDPSQNEVRRLFRYDAATSDLIWRNRPREDFATDRGMKIFNTRDAGKTAGCVNKTTGYRHIRINGRIYQTHRLIWIFHNGPVPEGLVIDHINNDPSDNCISNLRLATNSENLRNQRINNNNILGVKNVSIHAAGGYHVQVMIDGKRISKYSKSWTIEEAATYASNLRDELHGDFARHA